MAKKKKNLQQLIKKRQQLQQVGQVGVIPTASSPIAAQDLKIAAAVKPESTDQPAAIKVPGIGRTLISIVVIIILFAGAIVVNHKTTYLSTFGSWLYNATRLNNS